MAKRKKKFYAVAVGRIPGIYTTWSECEQQVKGYPKATFQGFSTHEEAQNFLKGKQSAPDPRFSARPVRPEGQPPTKRQRTTSNSGIQERETPPTGASKRIKSQVASIPPVESTIASSGQLASNNKAEAIVLSGEDLQFQIHFDGGSRGNPGIAGAGAVVQVEVGNTLWTTVRIREYLGRKQTNNVAEYTGLIRGLEQVLEEIQKIGTARSSRSLPKPNVRLVVKGDSELLVKQMKGIYQCKSPNLKGLYQRAKDLIKDMRACAGTMVTEFEHVYRRDNAEADALANEAMDVKRSWTTSHVDESFSATETAGATGAAGSGDIEWIVPLV